MVKVQEYINQLYPNYSQRNLVKKLDLQDKCLQGNMDLTSFSSLEELDCSNNNIASLQLNSSELRYLDCSRNNLFDLDLTQLNPEKLTYLKISNNNLSSRDLSMFSNFSNLEVLIIGSDNDKKHNNFVGSLQPLQNLSNLQELDISNTDIDSGLNYLPASLVSIHCCNDKRSNLVFSSSSIIIEALKPYNFQISRWRQDHDPNYVSIQLLHLQLKEKEEENKLLKKDLEETQQALAQISEELCGKETQEKGTQTTEETELVRKFEEEKIQHQTQVEIQPE
jgi:Leucine-rich repeat (LRR) protein